MNGDGSDASRRFLVGGEGNDGDHPAKTIFV